MKAFTYPNLFDHNHWMRVFLMCPLYLLVHSRLDQN